MIICMVISNSWIAVFNGNRNKYKQAAHTKNWIDHKKKKKENGSSVLLCNRGSEVQLYEYTNTPYS